MSLIVEHIFGVQRLERIRPCSPWSEATFMSLKSAPSSCHLSPVHLKGPVDTWHWLLPYQLVSFLHHRAMNVPIKTCMSRTLTGRPQARRHFLQVANCHRDSLQARVEFSSVTLKRTFSIRENELNRTGCSLGYRRLQDEIPFVRIHHFISRERHPSGRGGPPRDTATKGWVLPQGDICMSQADFVSICLKLGLRMVCWPGWNPGLHAVRLTRWLLSQLDAFRPPSGLFLQHFDLIKI